jgi:hypothetical protein
MFKWAIQAHFRHLRSKSFPMVLRAQQSIEIWPFNLPSEISRVHQDSLSQNGSCLGSVSVHSLTLPRTSLDSRECVVTFELPLGPHPSNVFTFAPRFPSSWLVTLQPLALVASQKLGLQHLLSFQMNHNSPFIKARIHVLSGYQLLGLSHGYWYWQSVILFFLQARICIPTKIQYIASTHCKFIFWNIPLLVMNKLVFNFQNMMDMHKGYAYQNFNSIAY